MANVSTRSGLLFFDFRYQGIRCREYTKLADTSANRRRMQSVLDRIEQAIASGKFDYATAFPGSKLAAKFVSHQQAAAVDPMRTGSASTAQMFSDFIETWFRDSLPGWRASHAATVRSTIDRHLTPFFGDMQIDAIHKADILRFRAEVAQRRGRAGNATLSAKTVNRIMQLLSQALAEAGDQLGFINPAEHIKRLKQRRVDIHPFSLADARQLIATIRKDYRAYLIVRLLTGMRTGEIHGLKWKYADFAHRQILVRETLVRGRVEYTKTDGSQREIAMSQPVYDALLEQRLRTGDHEYVFCTSSGTPIDNDNFTNRIWYPLLRHLGFDKRRPYQTRHTCATLWLAAGENPEWVARQLGHVDTTMLFRTYSRFIPNLTRRDGSAFNSLVSNVIHATESPCSDTDAASDHKATITQRPVAASEGSAERPTRQTMGTQP